MAPKSSWFQAAFLAAALVVSLPQTTWADGG